MKSELFENWVMYKRDYFIMTNTFANWDMSKTSIPAQFTLWKNNAVIRLGKV